MATCCRRSSGGTAIFATHLYNDDGKLRSFVNIYVNDEDIRHLEREQTALKAGDTVSIVPSVAGGSDAVVQREGRGTDAATKSSATAGI